MTASVTVEPLVKSMIHTPCGTELLVNVSGMTSPEATLTLAKAIHKHCEVCAKALPLQQPEA